MELRASRPGRIDHFFYWLPPLCRNWTVLFDHCNPNWCSGHSIVATTWELWQWKEIWSKSRNILSSALPLKFYDDIAVENPSKSHQSIRCHRHSWKDSWCAPVRDKRPFEWWIDRLFRNTERIVWLIYLKILDRPDCPVHQNYISPPWTAQPEMGMDWGLGRKIGSLPHSRVVPPCCQYHRRRRPHLALVRATQ